jgi:hypothetical protein
VGNRYWIKVNYLRGLMELFFDAGRETSMISPSPKGWKAVAHGGLSLPGRGVSATGKVVNNPHRERRTRYVSKLWMWTT